MESGPFAKEAMNTLIAPGWKIWLARLFGRSVFGSDGLYIVEMAEWRGTRYLIAFQHIEDGE